MAAQPGTVSFKGQSFTVSTGFDFASFYLIDGDSRPMIRFHRTEKSAQKGSWDSPSMKAIAKYAGYTIVQR